MIKTCKVCKLEKHFSEFKPGRFKCKSCQTEYNKKYYKNNRERLRSNSAKYKETNAASDRKRRWKKYGIKDLDKAELLRKTWNNYCQICKNHVPRGCVDHDHITGLVRGMLCRSCNTGLGAFKDNIESLLSAVKYLTGTT